MSTPPPDSNPGVPEPRVFRFKRLRKWLGLTQAQVARFAAIPLRQYRRIENQTHFSDLYEILNRISHAFGMSFRCNLMTGKSAGAHRRVATVAAVYRSPFLHIAFMNGDRTVSLRRKRIRAKNESAAVLEPLLLDFGCQLLVAEPGTVANRQFGHYTGEIYDLELAEAKQVIMPGSSRPTHRDLFEDLVRHYPELKNHVKVLLTGRIAMADAWRVNQLIPAALGIATYRQRSSCTIVTNP